MKKIYIAFSLAILMMFCITGISQTTIWSEDFTYPNGTIQGSGSPPKWTLQIPPSPDWFEVRSNQMEGKELDAEGVWTSELIDISGYQNIGISLDISEQGNLNGNDYINIYYRLDGSTTEYVIGEFKNDFGSASPSVSNVNGNSLDIIIYVRNDNNSHYHRFDNILITGTPIMLPPVADFVANKLTPEVGEVVYFTDLSTNGPTSWIWNISPSTFSFTNGTDQYSQHPVVQFNAIGSYSITLTATNSYGSGVVSKVDYITVVPPSYLMSDDIITTCEGTFYDSGGPTGNYSNGEDYTMTFYPTTAGNQLQFIFSSFEIQNATGGGNIRDYLNIYDGENASAPLIGQYYGTNSPGTVLSANAVGAITFVFHSNNNQNDPGWAADISCIPPQVPVADFSADDLNPEVGQTVTFTDLSSNVPDSWQWSFNPSTVTYVGGTDQNSQNPQVQFNETGPYSVSLTVSNIAGSDTEFKIEYVLVSAPAIIITNGSITTCEGSFYDSGGATANYGLGEDYVFTIYPSVAGNFVQVDFTSFELREPFWVIVDYLEIYNGENATSPLIGQYQWTDSPGTVSSTDATGALTFVFHSNNFGFIDPTSGWEATVSCFPPSAPAPDFVADNTTPVTGEAVQFTDLSLYNPTAWSWSFTPGTITFLGGTDASSQNPMVSFNEEGLYTVSLTASNAYGNNTETKIDYINAVDCSISSFPWTEGFENGGAIPECWTQEYISGDNVDWQFLTGNGDTHPSTAHNGTYNACLRDSDSNDDQTMLITPKLDLSLFDEATLSFWHTQEFWNPDQDFLSLYYRTSEGGTWTLIQTWNTEIVDWTQEIINLPNINGSYYLGFEGNAKWGYGVCLDDVSISAVNLEPEMVWSGNVDTDWDDPNNWLNLELPGSGNNVTIPDGLSNYPIFNGNLDLGLECKNINMLGTSQLTVLGDLTIPTGYNLICNAASRIYVEGDWTNNGSFNPGISTVEFTGNANSIISGTPLKSIGTENLPVFELKDLPTDLTVGQSHAESDPKAKPVSAPVAKAIWDLQFSIDVDNPSGLTGIAGSETDGTYLYGTKWNGTGEIVKFDLFGNYIETFTIPGVVNLRDLAYDGQYFYGSDASNYIWEMDFDAKVLVSTITTADAVRAIAYDADLDGFWFNNWDSDLQFINRSGVVLNTITAPPSMYGCAYDNVSAGGPFLWIFTGTTSGLGCQVEQYDLNTKTLTGITHSVSSDLGDYIAGGLWLQSNLIEGTITLGGLAQGTPDLIFGYEIGTKGQFYNLTVNKTNAEVIISNHTLFSNNITVVPGAWLTNEASSNSDVEGQLILQADATGMASFIDNGTLNFDQSSKAELYLIPDQWHYVSSPITDALSGVFMGIYLRGFDETTDSWGEYITATDSSLSMMTGYAAWAAGDPATVTFEGTLASGPMSLTVTAQSTGVDVGWNFVGNPYPSYLDWDAESAWNKGPVDNTIYYYTGATGLGNYKYYQGAGGELPGIGVNGGTNEIPPMQGFFVHAGGDGTLSVGNNARIHSGQSYYKSGNSVDAATIRLQVENAGGIKDETVIRFHEPATTEFDGAYDAVKMFAGIQQLYSVTTGGTELAVNTLPECNSEVVIDLGFVPTTEGTFALLLSEFIYFDPGVKVYLEDLLTGDFQLLNGSPDYTFTSNPDDEPMRFKLHFTILSDVDETISAPVKIFAYDNTICIKHPVEYSKAVAHVTDMLGREIYAEDISGRPITTIQLEGVNGIYMVWLETEKGIYTKKVMLK